MASHIYFVRHGESEENATRVYLGDAAALTKQGKDQATFVAERIRAIGVDGLLTSPFIRAKDTAAAIAVRTGLTAEEYPLLSEWPEPSELIGMHVEDPVRQEVREAIRSAEADYRHSDEETFTELAERARTVLAFLEARPEERLCVVTHGAFLRALVGVMTLGPAFTKQEFFGFMRHFFTSNTGITYAYFDSDKHIWKLVTWNDQAHLGE